MAEITAAGRIPLLVGGTMLYFHALQHGLTQLPAADAQVRAEIDRRAARLGWGALHAELARVDPASAARIHTNDPQRIQRALEVFYLTGRRLSELHAADGVQPLEYRCIKLAVAPASRALLHARIVQRFQAMLAAGFLEEVTGLHARDDLTPAYPSMRSAGYRQLWEYLDGGCSLDTAVQRGITATRRFAKRQLTWLRAEAEVHWFDSDAPQLAGGVRTLLHRALDTGA
jgi:tRNA dimethylallyltransferase